MSRRRHARARAVVLVLALLALLAPGAVAWADARKVVPVRLELAGDRVLASFRVSEAFVDGFRKRVAGGLESRVEIETRLVDREGSTVGRGHRTCKLLYSLWDERLYVSVVDEGGDRPTVGTFSDIERALEACGTVRGLPVALSGALTLADGYRLETQMVLNPVSEELVERSRQFVTNPSGGSRGGTSSVLGAVAGLFSRRGGALGDTFEFTSLPLARPSARSVAEPRTPGGIPLAQTRTPTRSGRDGGRGR